MRKHKAGQVQNGFTMMIVDDDVNITSALRAYFEASGYQVDTEHDPERSLLRMRKKHYDILILDYLMRPICGDVVVSRLREFDKRIFVIMLTGHKELAPPLDSMRSLDIQGYYEKSDRFDQLELLVESSAKSIRQMRSIDDAYLQLRDSYMQTVEALRLIVDAKDIYTRGHSDRVSYYATRLARLISDDEQFAERVRIAGLLHDIGKVGTSDTILCNPGSLSEEQLLNMRRHPQLGADILSPIAMFENIAPIVAAHHERYDGSGYPNGLQGEQIPLEARVISIADAFDAMMSDRHYRRHLSLEHAISELLNGRGTQFDPALVALFVKMMENYEEISEQLEWTLENARAQYGVGG